MNHLSVENLSKSFHENALFDGLNFGLEAGSKAALVGRNGSGKTTLLRILAGQEKPDTGVVAYKQGLRVAFLPQQPQFEPGKTVRQALYDPKHPHMALVMEYEQLVEEAAQNPKANDRLQELLPQMDAHNLWDFESQVKQTLGKLGIHQLDQFIDELSGGQRKRVALARALLERPDLLILDEPTNHLDLQAIEWLEDYLSRAQLTLLLVSHDRYFLERATNEILELDGGQLHRHPGSYGLYLERKAERISQQNQAADKAHSLMKKELDWVRRQPQARGTKAKYRLDAFEDLKDRAKDHVKESRLEIDVKTRRLGGKILELEHVKKAYDGRTLIEDFNYIFRKGDRVGIVGPNGVGKSTFLNLIAGLETPTDGNIVKGETVVIGYYTQEELSFNPEHRVIDIVKEVAEVIETGTGKTLTASQFLNQFLFPPDKQYTPVGKLSGGERRRLQLLRVLIKNPNFLILDEPTNDLDIDTLNVLEDYLENFSGCLMMVSHDRFFMDRLVEHLFVFEGKGHIRDFPGNYTDYRVTKQAEEAEQQQTEKKEEEPVKKEQKAAAPKRKLSFKEQREFEQLEQDIASLEERKASLIENMNQGGDHEALTAWASELEEINDQLDEKEMRWLELSELA